MVLRARSIGSSRLAFGNATLDAAAADRAALAAATARFRAAFRRGAKIFDDSEYSTRHCRDCGASAIRSVKAWRCARRDGGPTMPWRKSPRSAGSGRRARSLATGGSTSSIGAATRIPGVAGDCGSMTMIGMPLVTASCTTSPVPARPCARPPFQTATRTSILESMTSLARS